MRTFDQQKCVQCAKKGIFTLSRTLYTLLVPKTCKNIKWPPQEIPHWFGHRTREPIGFWEDFMKNQPKRVPFLAHCTLN